MDNQPQAQTPVTDPQNTSSYKLGDTNINTVENATPNQMDNRRILGRQIPSGNIRGNQTITGSLIINNSTTNKPILAFSGDDETIVVSDANGLRRIIIGKLPNNIYGMAISKPGIDVFTAF